MEPSAAIAVIETDLRHLVRVVLEKAHGFDWLAKNLDAAAVDKLQERLEEERKRRAPAKVPSELTAYMHLYELRKVIEKTWQEFSSALGEKKEFVVLMDKVEDFRNAPAHSRELLPHERSLLDGIAGTVRTQVTMYVSSQDPDNRHYPIIESIRDSFGNEPTSESMKFNPLVETGLMLQVGTVVEFDARGWDPQGRDLTWRWGVPSTTSDSPSVSGNEVHFIWSPTEDNVGAGCFLTVDMLSSGRYHRGAGVDHSVIFRYSVEPPAMGSLSHVPKLR